MTQPLRLRANPGLKQRRLAELSERAGSAAAADAREQLADAQVLGSLELAGHRFRWEEVRAARRGAGGPREIVGLQRAQAALEPGSAFRAVHLLEWHRAALGGGALRTASRERESGPAPAPPELIAGRLEILEQWLSAASAGELTPAQAGALVMARVLEIAPFDDGNGRVARLAASHLMVRAGGPPPVLVGADAPRLQAATGAAFRLDTEPLAALLEEAGLRSFDVLSQALERHLLEREPEGGGT